MDVPADVLQTLKCSRCETYLSRSPVYLQHDGAAMCGHCFSPEHPATRMLQYEALVRLVRFPCRHQNLGCPVMVPFVNEGEVISHEEVCEHRQHVCPVLDSARCDWFGTRADILQHCSSQHSDLVLQNPTTFRHDITRANTQTYLLTAFQVLFLLYTKVCLASGRIYYSVRHLGTSDEAAKYNYTLHIKRGKVCVSKSGDVAPEDHVAIQEPTSLSVNTNSLLDLLGGFEGTKFTVTVKRRVICAACGVIVPGLLYRDEDGWQCERCAPARRTCSNLVQDCTHTDIFIKCEKHEAYFCRHRIRCAICEKAMPRGSMSAHYDSEHAAETHIVGSTWHATQTSGRWCFVPSVAGTAVCWYMLKDSRFELSVRIPVPSERLSEFRCTVRLTHRETGHTCTYALHASYTCVWDWFIQVMSKELPSCSGEFDACVDITRARTE